MKTTKKIQTFIFKPKKSKLKIGCFVKVKLGNPLAAILGYAGIPKNSVGRVMKKPWVNAGFVDFGSHNVLVFSDEVDVVKGLV